MSDKGIYPVINDYSCVHSKCAEFLYYPVDIIEGLAMRSYHFVSIIETRPAKHMKNEIELNYKYSI